MRVVACGRECLSSCRCLQTWRRMAGRRCRWRRMLGVGGLVLPGTTMQPALGLESQACSQPEVPSQACSLCSPSFPRYAGASRMARWTLLDLIHRLRHPLAMAYLVASSLQQGRSLAVAPADDLPRATAAAAAHARHTSPASETARQPDSPRP